MMTEDRNRSFVAFENFFGRNRGNTITYFVLHFLFTMGYVGDYGTKR